jgi:hypothetical protein
MEASIEIKLDSSVLEKAKRYAKSQKRSLSEIVATYLVMLAGSGSEATDELEISPFVKSMETGNHVPSDLDLKALMAEKAERKHN